jgi:hypothetical protein
MVSDPPDEGEEESDESGLEAVLKGLQQEVLDRKRGIFTQSDREFLLEMKQYKHEQSVINKRRDIRDRVKSGFLDLQLLRLISESDRSDIFSQIDKGDIHESVAVFISFIYSGLGGNTDAIEQMVESGLFKAERGGVRGYAGGARNVEVDINLEREYDAEAIYQRLQRGYGDTLTPAEIGVLVREGKLGADEHEELRWKEDERPFNMPAANRDQWYRGDEKE